MVNKFPLVSIIVVNWNGGQIFKDCVETLQNLEYPNWELIIVDNGSTDGSDRFKFTKTKVKIVRNKTNVGFAPANNIGYRFASGKHILFLNNDTKVPPDLLSILVKKIESDSTLGVIQPKIVFMDEPDTLDNAGAFLTWTGFLTHWGFGAKDSKEFDKEKQIFSAKGACMLVRTSLIEEVGLFDSDFISYFEETDFCWRVWLSGYKVLYFPKTKILHKVGFTSKRLLAVDVNYHSMKNRISSLYKNLGLISLFKVFVAHILLIEILSLYYLLTFETTKFLMIQKAIWWNLKNIGKLNLKRNKVQMLRRVNETKLLRIIMRKFDWEKMFIHFKRVESDFKHREYPKNDEVLEIGRIKSCIDFLTSQTLEDKILVDVGCSTGLLESKLISSKIRKIIAIDPNKDAVDYAKQNVSGADFSVSTADKIPANNNECDVAVMFDVIEHVPYGTEKVALKEAARTLKKGGTFLLTTPNNSFITNLLDPAWYLGHRHYKPNNIKNLIQSVGLKVQSVEIKGSIWSSIYMLWFYIMKWVFNKKTPRSIWLEKKEDEGYTKPGIFTIFIKATK